MNAMTVSKINKIIDENKTVKGIQDKVSKIDDRLSNLETRFDGLETRFDGLELRFDGLETRFDGLKTSFTGMEEQMHRFGINQENMMDTMNTILERVSPVLKKGELYDEIKESVEQHDLRLKTVEYTLKKHLKEDH